MESKNILEYLPEVFEGKNGEVKLSEIKESPLIGIYFSAHWCPPCRGFTPILSKFYNEINKEKKQIEIIFISFDRDEKSFKEYYDTMPWVTLPFSNDKKKTIAKAYSINGIPALFVFDNQGKLIDSDARTTVQAKSKNGFSDDIVSEIIKKWNK